MMRNNNLIGMAICRHAVRVSGVFPSATSYSFTIMAMRSSLDKVFMQGLGSGLVVAMLEKCQYCIYFHKRLYILAN